MAAELAEKDCGPLIVHKHAANVPVFHSRFGEYFNHVSSFSKGVGVFSERTNSKTIDFNPLCMFAGRLRIEPNATKDVAGDGG
jgi:hypothetical protein